jgi:hypothetical protein
MGSHSTWHGWQRLSSLAADLNEVKSLEKKRKRTDEIDPEPESKLCRSNMQDIGEGVAAQVNVEDEGHADAADAAAVLVASACASSSLCSEGPGTDSLESHSAGSVMLVSSCKLEDDVQLEPADTQNEDAQETDEPSFESQPLPCGSEIVEDLLQAIL